MVGDDRQLGAVGAGGLLRDIAAAHGAARLSEVVRFDDPAEAAASLALRNGRAEALGFYLDQDRVHVGDPTTAADQLFAAWSADRAAGLDALMLAPTNERVADLNARARHHRLGSTNDVAELPLADGNTASVGDLILCRRNDRRLLISAGRWVRNGDRFTVRRIEPDGGIIAGVPGERRRETGKGTPRGTRGGTGRYACPPTTSPPRSSSDTPAPSMSPKASPATPFTA